MPSIADSNALCLPERVLSQHQAALTLLKSRLEHPSVTSVCWLDLGCGRGQILLNADRVFGTDKLRKVRYVGVDVNQSFALQAQRAAEQLFADPVIHVCDLHNFERLLSEAEQFDFVSFTNTAHEITPTQLATTLVSSLCRAKPDGEIFLYDMESLPTLELGAIPWIGGEVQEIINAILEAVGEAAYRPDVAVWLHNSCRAWSLHVNRSYFTAAPEVFATNRDGMIRAATRSIASILQHKLLDIHQALDALRRFGSGTPEQFAEKQRLLFDFWAISATLRLHEQRPDVTC